MLVLSRKVGEKVFIGDDIVITVVRMGPTTVRLGIAAPKDTRIVRQELIAKNDSSAIEATAAA